MTNTRAKVGGEPNRSVTFAPLTAERWSDLETLFGPRGACGGCWCMYWRVEKARWREQKGEGNRRALKRLVDAGEPLGVIAYVNDRPAGWCAVAPRTAYPGLARSRILQPVDDRPVWSITCFFVARPFRRQGLTSGLIAAATEYARAAGADLVEAYPNEPERPAADVFVWTGLASPFFAAGFEEVARRSPHRPVLRKVLRPGRRDGTGPGAGKSSRRDRRGRGVDRAAERGTSGPPITPASGSAPRRRTTQR